MAREIPLTRGKVALVDDADYERVSRHKWCVLSGRDHDHWYANNKSLGLLHRFLMGVSENVMIDHKNDNGLDCRRENMRVATNTQNQHNARKRIDNKSGYRGVHAVRYGWVAQMKLNGVQTYLGYFKSREAAARAYDAKVRETRGEFAKTNFQD